MLPLAMGSELFPRENEFDMIPTLKSKVLFEDSIHVKEVLRCFKLLDAEDPSLRVFWDEHFQEIHVHVMGVIQLRSARTNCFRSFWFSRIFWRT